MPATIAKAFIPRILGNVTVSQIRDAFAAKQIGKVKNIDIHRRKNEKNNQYSFAFIELALYDTKEATELCEDILDNGSSKVFYDRKNYWEVKAFLTKSERAAKASEQEHAHEPVVPLSFDGKPSLDSRMERTPTLVPRSGVLTIAAVAQEDADDIRAMCITPPVRPDLAWIKMAIHSELLHTHHTREIEQTTCNNCGDESNPDCTTSIFWKNYSFCSDRCQWELESDIRKHCKRAQEPVLPAFQLKDDYSTTSKFIEMFERIQHEAAEEMPSIRYLCSSLIKRPSVFTKEDREEMARDYEALQKEMAIA
jgi:hypothetical protein